jgi:hypothetical protein
MPLVADADVRAQHLSLGHLPSRPVLYSTTVCLGMIWRAARQPPGQPCARVGRVNGDMVGESAGTGRPSREVGAQHDASPCPLDLPPRRFIEGGRSVATAELRSLTRRGGGKESDPQHPN